MYIIGFLKQPCIAGLPIAGLPCGPSVPHRWSPRAHVLGWRSERCEEKEEDEVLTPAAPTGVNRAQVVQLCDKLWRLSALVYVFWFVF